MRTAVRTRVASSTLLLAKLLLVAAEIMLVSMSVSVWDFFHPREGENKC